MAKRCVLAAEAASRIVRKRIEVLRKLQSAAQQEDADAIHDMRVASRRLRAALMEHAALFDKAAYKAFRNDIRSVTQNLGTARELDVCLEYLDRHRGKLHGDPRHALNYVIRVLRKKRATESNPVTQCAAWLQSSEFANRLMDLFVSIRPSKTCYVKGAGEELQERYQGLRRLHSLWESARAEEMLHRIRIEFKKLRYACEVYEPLYGSAMADFIAQLKDAQDALGHWNDLRVLRDYVVSAGPDATPHAAEGMPGLIAWINELIQKRLMEVSTACTAFFSHSRAVEILDFFEKVQMPCCKGAAPDPEILDAAYGG